MTGPDSRRDAGLFLTTFLAAAAVRSMHWPRVLTSEGVVFPDGDAYYHMWRIWNAASRSVPLWARDPFVNFPHGGEILWSPAFDWILATAVRWLDLDHEAAEWMCAWVSVVLGSAAVAVAACVSSRTFSRLAGWVTGGMLAVLPGSFIYTRLGYLDHHAAIALIGTLMLGGAMRVTSRADAGGPAWPVLGGAVCAMALATWAGALVHIGILQIAMLAWSLGCASPEQARRRTLGLALAHAVACVAILPLSLRTWEMFGDWSPLALTRFQPVFFGAGAIHLAVTTLLWRAPLFGATRVRRLAAAASLAALGLGLAFAFIPGLLAALERAAAWFSDDVAFLASVNELAPLFGSGGPPPWRGPVLMLSPLFFFLPLALLAILAPPPRTERWLLAFWCASFCALTLLQFRFINTFSVAYALVWGGAIAWCVDRSRAWIPRRPARHAAWALAGSVLLATLLVPAGFYHAPLLGPGITVDEASGRARRAASRWLATSSPVVLDADGRPGGGVLCAWGRGHEVRYYSGWPVHQDGFGPYVSPENTALAQRYFEAREEAEAVRILDELGTRYVLTDIAGAGYPPYGRTSMTWRLVRLHGSGSWLSVGPRGRRQWVPALTRHRLVFQAPDPRGGVYLYEFVRGAQVVGRAPPGSRVSAELDLVSAMGGGFTWTSRTRADDTGAFELRLPYATRGGPRSGVAPRGAYRLRTSEGTVGVETTEAAVTRGETIALPPLEPRDEPAEADSTDPSA